LHYKVGLYTLAVTRLKQTHVAEFHYNIQQ